MKQIINWNKYKGEEIPLADNYEDRYVLCRWNDGTITTEQLKYERLNGRMDRKYYGYIAAFAEPEYWAEIK